jgi:hypothetical protein
MRDGLCETERKLLKIWGGKGEKTGTSRVSHEAQRV